MILFLIGIGFMAFVGTFLIQWVLSDWPGTYSIQGFAIQALIIAWPGFVLIGLGLRRMQSSQESQGRRSVIAVLFTVGPFLAPICIVFFSSLLSGFSSNSIQASTLMSSEQVGNLVVLALWVSAAWTIMVRKRKWRNILISFVGIAAIFSFVGILFVGNPTTATQIVADIDATAVAVARTSTEVAIAVTAQMDSIISSTETARAEAVATANLVRSLVPFKNLCNSPKSLPVGRLSVENNHFFVFSDGAINLNFQNVLDDVKVATSDRDVTAVVCIEPLQTEVETCQYREPSVLPDTLVTPVATVRRIRNDIRFHLIDVATASTAATTILVGGNPQECPPRISGDPSSPLFIDTYHGISPTPEDFLSWLNKITG